MQTYVNCQDFFPNDATSINNIEHGLSNIENVSLPSAGKGSRGNTLMSVIPQHKKRQLYDYISIRWYSEEASKIFGSDGNTMESNSNPL